MWRHLTAAPSGTLIGSNIFNGLCVLAIPGLLSSPEMYLGWNYSSWSPLLLILFIVTLIFSAFIARRTFFEFGDYTV